MTIETVERQDPFWRTQLEQAFDAERKWRRLPLMQLATVRDDGRPANRTLVCRGFIEGTDSLIFTTDNRGAKAKQSRSPPNWAEACWYLGEAREQYRIGGLLLWVHPGATGPAGDARHNAWSALSIETRRTFYWPEPGTLVATRDPHHDPVATAVDLDEPPACFSLLVLEPLEVDHLELNPMPHRRRIYTRDDTRQWIEREVNP